jgi:hypothetical protein
MRGLCRRLESLHFGIRRCQGGAGGFARSGRLPRLSATTNASAATTRFGRRIRVTDARLGFSERRSRCAKPVVAIVFNAETPRRGDKRRESHEGSLAEINQRHWFRTRATGVLEERQGHQPCFLPLRALLRSEHVTSVSVISAIESRPSLRLSPRLGVSASKTTAAPDAYATSN